MIHKLKNFNSETAQEVAFYEMHQDGSTEEGTTLEEMIRVTADRLKILNNAFPCRENSLALTKLEEALHWLQARTADRVARGVEGTHQA